jgi:uncharacterized coiled-coil protein SlyX
MPLLPRRSAPSYNYLEETLATPPRRPRNLPAPKTNPLRDLVSQKSRAADAARERRRVQELKSELPSIIQERVGEQFQKLENRLLTEVKEIGQRAIEESTAAISEQLSGRIETLEKVSAMQTQTLAGLRDSSEVAERKVSEVVDQIEKSLASVVPGFELEPRKMPPLPELPRVAEPQHQPAQQRRRMLAPEIEYVERMASQPAAAPPPQLLSPGIQRLRMPQMPPVKIAEILSFTLAGAELSGADHPQFSLEPPVEIVKADPVDLSEIVGKFGFCPSCTSTDVRRASRKGLFEEFLRLFFISPFRCRSCRHKFYRF